ncbi:MAG: glycosyltransferase [Verrucomicrobia bacterium]|nr:glycosyltransferase [Verrucomicrobiota bacterium]MCH8514414.1 glycosyltransferase [Kiritimatiellia bacterium]
MKISVITPSFQSAPFLERCVDSVLAQRHDGVDLEYLFIDGGSTDGTLEKVRAYGDQVDQVISEPDQGPADAINKGFQRATGDVLAWLNADDEYLPGALARVVETFQRHPEAAFCFGHCPIIDASGTEIRRGVTRVKRFFYPLSSRFTHQSINYISQPASFYRREAAEAAGPLRLDFKAAWDYEFLLRLWRQGPGIAIGDPPLAQFRWHSASISGQHFRLQFDEELQIARDDAGKWSPQSALHLGVKWGILGIYSLMNAPSRKGRA